MTLYDILNDLGSDVAILCINENNVEHAYFGYDEIDFWDAEVENYFIVKKEFGYLVCVEIRV